MARRPRKHPVPEAASSPFLLSLESFAPPLDPRSLFPRHAPVELEVGCGKGLFLARAAVARPDLNFLGIEVSAPYARLCAGKLSVADATNARVIPGDAKVLVQTILADESLEAVHVYFPDPWWKARHRKRRVLSPEFIAHVGRVLGAGRLLHVWTDVEEYFNETVRHVAATGLFEPPRRVEEQPAEHDLDYRTHFERRTRIAGQPVWRAAFERNVIPPPARMSVATPRRDDAWPRVGREPRPQASDTRP